MIRLLKTNNCVSLHDVVPVLAYEYVPSLIVVPDFVVTLTIKLVFSVSPEMVAVEVLPSTSNGDCGTAPST